MSGDTFLSATLGLAASCSGAAQDGSSNGLEAAGAIAAPFEVHAE